MECGCKTQVTWKESKVIFCPLHDVAPETARQRDRLWGALEEAVRTIRALHGEPGWDIYKDNAPEMKRIQAAIAATEPAATEAK